jgi:hypothetical protein
MAGTGRDVTGHSPVGPGGRSSGSTPESIWIPMAVNRITEPARRADAADRF